jgi:hypothetical protein
MGGGWEWLPLRPEPEEPDEEHDGDEYVEEGGQGEEGEEGEEGEDGDEVLCSWRRRPRESSWIGKDPQGQECTKRSLTVERAAAAGVDVAKYFDASRSRLDWRDSALCQAVRRAELAAADAEQTQARQAAEARRKRVRRIEEGKEDRDALREFARSRDDGTCLELEATPAGVRETAADGTPRSAKAAGADLLKLTQSFYARLMTLYRVSPEELETVEVRAQTYQLSESGWRHTMRPLKRFRGKRGIVEE